MSYPDPQSPYAASHVPPSYPPPQMAGSPYPPFPAPVSSYAPQYPPYAGWWQRAGAFLLDCLINFGPLWLLIGVADAVDRPQSGDSGETAAFILGWVAFAVMLVVCVVQLIREGRTGQTVGKKALGIQVLRVYDGLAPGIGLALARRICQLLNYPAFGLGWLWASWDTKQQTFADKLTSVVVVRADTGPPAQPATGDYRQAAR
ncbi:RDD family protein [Streptomyces sp. G5(2025)]|uniref:RDD family protein n=1 Tax=Streptomyces sp. G5(2025) TaxID=3406628 RepID=UPI003C21C846